DNLCPEESQVILEYMEFPERYIQVKIESKTKADQDKIDTNIQKHAEEDPTFRAETDSETGETVITGMGELQLEVIVDRLKREFKVEANVGAPQVSYRETFTKTVEAEGKFIRQSGGKGQYGHVWIEFSPLEEGKASNLKMQLLGELFRANTFQQL